MNEVNTILRNIYGEEFMNFNEQLINNLQNDVTEENGTLIYLDGSNKLVST
ncbi:hypothetical protein J7E81_24745 [Bacillus sp. ISL-18]|uniref:hypothetical protein n=1 Tax=Bacillus sp. ISL-18 TaxID=2819118 RepID=UPI001BE6DF03|nr:hypothetical protein [Bacillus sp. ISL-18]MBT2658394.1 hypothetical protein [Bacillus sp. ISL-18]